MIPVRQYVVFHINDQQHALPLETVDRIIHAVAVTPVPGATPPTVGMINVQGCMMPVVSLRLRFGLPPQAIAPGDQFVIVRRDGRPMALIVDAVTGLLEVAASDASATDPPLAQPTRVAGIHQGAAGMILLHDVEHLLGRITVPGGVVPGAQRGAAN